MRKNVARLLSLCVIVALVAVAGCSGRAQVSGKVTFADGTPLDCGVVNFANDTTICKGEINKEDGTFKMRTFKPGDGVPPGTYKVYVTETLKFGDSGKEVSTGDVAFSMIGTSTNLVDPKYSNPDESGLTITVKGSMKYDIKLDCAPPAAEESAE